MAEYIAEVIVGVGEVDLAIQAAQAGLGVAQIRMVVAAEEESGAGDRVLKELTLNPPP